MLGVFCFSWGKNINFTFHWTWSYSLAQWQWFHNESSSRLFWGSEKLHYFVKDKNIGLLFLTMWGMENRQPKYLWGFSVLIDFIYLQYIRYLIVGISHFTLKPVKILVYITINLWLLRTVICNGLWEEC